MLRLASPVISASCENCTTSNLSTPIEITFTHLPYDKVSQCDNIYAHMCMRSKALTESSIVQRELATSL